MKKIFVTDIKERDWVESPFLVRDKITAMAKNGKPYLTLKLMDRSGEVEGRIWDRVDEFSARFERDDFLRVQGKASVYLGKMQLIIQDLERLEEEQVDLADFLPVSSFDGEILLLRLRERVAGLTDPHLRQLMEIFLGDQAFLEKYRTAPAAKSMHHVFLGGLLEHSLAVADLVEDVARRYPDLNRDLMLVGALLHDIGKVEELTFARSFDYSDEGKLLGHIVIGVEMVEEKLRSLSGFPRELAVHLKHLLLSHHGQYEYGSPKRPKTLEATVLSYLDDLDSKINGIRTHIDRELQNDGGWTSYHRLYDRYFYKGGRPAPAAKVSPLPEPEKKDPEPRSEKTTTGERRASKQFGFTLADQLRGKSLDLFAGPETDKDDSC